LTALSPAVLFGLLLTLIAVALVAQRMATA
jgi:Flp pilus assembly pilin Flp